MTDAARIPATIITGFLGAGKTTLVRYLLETARGKRPHDALTYYRRALDVLEGDTSAEVPVLKARALRGAADIYYLELRDTKHAIEVYRELIKQCPDAPETMEGRIFLADLLHVYRRDLRAAITEPARQQFGLCRLARAVTALEGDPDAGASCHAPAFFFAFAARVAAAFFAGAVLAGVFFAAAAISCQSARRPS